MCAKYDTKTPLRHRIETRSFLIKLCRVHESALAENSKIFHFYAAMILYLKLEGLGAPRGVVMRMDLETGLIILHTTATLNNGDFPAEHRVLFNRITGREGCHADKVSDTLCQSSYIQGLVTMLICNGGFTHLTV